MSPRVRKTAARAPAPARPFVKWAGGKGAVAEQIESLLPCDWQGRPYREPFVGGGAMFFHLQPARAVLSDALLDLVHAYRVVQTDVEALIARLSELAVSHGDDHFYRIRDAFNARCETSPAERAAWLIYLNKTCFNGLFRTNRAGLFNVPIGRYANPTIVDVEGLRRSARALTGAEIRHAPFERLLLDAEPGDVVYLDPPYVPKTRTASFTGYAGGFTLADQTRLADVFRQLDARGCLLVLSQSDTPEVRALYRGFAIRSIIAPRAISSKASTRGEVTELVIRNLARYPSVAKTRPRQADAPELRRAHG